MNKWYSWRKHTLERLLPSPERGHSVSSWVPLTWKASWEQLQLWYGAGHVWEGQAHFYLHDGELSRAPPDATFIHMLRQNCSLTGPHFPPPAIVEALQDYVTHYYKVSAFAPHCCGPVRLGSTTLPEPRQSLISFGIFLIVMPHTVWAHSGQMAQSRHFGASICIWICLRWFWMSELPCLASKGWTFICSIGHLHKRHASFESRVFSPFGYGTFLWFIRTGVSDQCPSGSSALVWLARRWTDAWLAYYQRWGVAY